MKEMADKTAPLVKMEGAELHFPVGGLIAQMRGRAAVVKAVDGVTFELRRGESVGLLGESGCGKTSTGRMLVQLDTATGGRVEFDGEDISQLKGEALRRFRGRSQMIFQNPFEALNPRFTIRAALAEPLENALIAKAEQENRILRAMALVKLGDAEQFLDRYPHQLSGGQLQRIVMARALILEPDFVVADEPVSMLDVSVRAGVLNVFREVKAKTGITAIYISHDLALVRYVCERTIVMYLGRIVEDGPTEEIVVNPLHPYTNALVAAVPVPHPNQSHDPLPIGRGAPDPRNPPSGCTFRDRCPKAFARCVSEVPGPIRVGNCIVHCHLYDKFLPETET